MHNVTDKRAANKLGRTLDADPWPKVLSEGSFSGYGDKHQSHRDVEEMPDGDPAAIYKDCWRILADVSMTVH